MNRSSLISGQFRVCGYDFLRINYARHGTLIAERTLCYASQIRGEFNNSPTIGRTVIKQ